MRSINVSHLTLAALLLSSLGCSSSNKGKIEGTWVSSPADARSGAPKAQDRSLTFDKDSKMIYTVGKQPHLGTYALGLGPSVTFHLENEVDGRKIHPQKIEIDGERLILTEPNGTQRTFHKFP